MTESFRDFKFENLNGVEVSLVVEAPIGSQIINTTVGPKGTYPFSPSASGVRGVKIKVTASGHEEYPDVKTIDLSSALSTASIETLHAQSSIGSIRGRLTVHF